MVGAGVVVDGVYERVVVTDDVVAVLGSMDVVGDGAMVDVVELGAVVDGGAMVDVVELGAVVDDGDMLDVELRAVVEGIITVVVDTCDVVEDDEVVGMLELDIVIGGVVVGAISGVEKVSLYQINFHKNKHLINFYYEEIVFKAFQSYNRFAILSS